MAHNGLFISVEGIDGSGKTTLISKLDQALNDMQKNVLLTKEPGGSSLGKHLRAILQEHPEKLDGKAEFLLFAADRSQHFSHVVIPALENGNVVITDRCCDSSLAYQGYGHHVDLKMMRTVNAWAMQDLEPDIIFYLKTSSEAASRRLAQTRSKLTSFEKESTDFWDRVIAGYEEIFSERSNVYTLDASAQPEQVFTQAWNHLSKFL